MLADKKIVSPFLTEKAGQAYIYPIKFFPCTVFLSRETTRNIFMLCLSATSSFANEASSRWFYFVYFRRANGRELC